MARRRRKKSTFAFGKRWTLLKKRLTGLFGKSLLRPLPHSSVFVAGVGIGLIGGLTIGLTLAWVDGRHHTMPKPARVASIAAPKATPTAPPVVQEAPPPPAAPPPAYVEQTEPQPDNAETDDSAAIPQGPMAAAPEPPAPAPFTPLPQAATPDSPEAIQPAWMKNAVASIDPGNHPMIAIVLDDVGAAPSDAPGAVSLPAPITLSIMTYAPNAAHLAEAARKAGHEIMVHVPMEPINRDADPGKNALLTSLSREEILRRLQWDLAQFQGYVGINNHMGSRFTQDAEGMQVVLGELKARGLLFLDSRTIASSVGDSLAARLGLTHLKRDVFLDNVIDEADIRKALARAEAVAKKQGFAIAIGHPHPDTVAALRQWIPEAKAKGFVLVPITAVAKKQAGVTG
jgi:polysaccharide deacetylase 2 family uncharacterized protein YibQ